MEESGVWHPYGIRARATDVMAMGRADRHLAISPFAMGVRKGIDQIFLSRLSRLGTAMCEIIGVLSSKHLIARTI